MPRRRPLYFGWYDQRRNRLMVSRSPPDAPVRLSIQFEHPAEVTEMLERKRADILWSPELPQDLNERLSRQPAI